jgi:molybdopterin-guanine dinucleotide biosynthesis protein A
MPAPESPADVGRWFRAAIQRVWPIAEGSLSLRRSRCIRKKCLACSSGKRHASYVLSGRRGSHRFSIYVPNELAPAVQQAIENGRRLQELMNEAGVRFVHALKKQRKG